MAAVHRFVSTLAIAVVSTAAAFAGDDAGAPPPPQVQTSPGGIQYVIGGAGAESQGAIEQMKAAFPLRIVFSAPGGAYAVAEHVSIKKGDAAVLDVDRAGPMLLVKLQPGTYRVEATVDGRTERREVKVGGAPQTLNWRVAAR